jgi:hypothetical protein
MSEEQIQLETQINNLEKNLKEENISIFSEKMSYPNVIEYQIIIHFPNEKIDKEKEKLNELKEYVFIIEISLTKHEIRLFSKNINSINDGRDLFRDLTLSKNNNFTSDFDLNIIVSAIKQFLKNIKGIDTRMGYFYIDSQYDLNILNVITEGNKNLLFSKVKLMEKVNNRNLEIPVNCLISEDYFCLFENIPKNKFKIKLTFYSSLKILKSFNKSYVGSIITLLWKQYGPVEYEMKLTSENDDLINQMVEFIIQKIRNFGFHMDIIKRKDGKLPEINISKIEREISQMEIQMKNGGNILIFNKLISNYEKAVEYYSAVGDTKYESYNKKIQELLKNEKFNKFVK